MNSAATTRVQALLLGMILLVGPAHPAEDDLVSLFKAISPSVGALYVQESGGDLKFNCTVTAVERTSEATLLLTAAHCVQKGEAYLVTFDGRVFWSAAVWKLPREIINPEKYRRSHKVGAK